MPGPRLPRADEAPQPLDLGRVRALGGPAMLRQVDSGRLYVWSGRNLTRVDGTVAGVDDEGPWVLAAAPVDRLQSMVTRSKGVDGYRLAVYLNTGRDPYHDKAVR